MNIGILTSGGDAPGMNAFISNFVRLAGKKNEKVFAVKFGYQGLIDNTIFELGRKDVDHISHLGGSFIKSFRCPEFQTEKGLRKGIQNYKKNKLDCLVVIGGDGSLSGANKLIQNGVNVIFIPATIDNDLFYTDKTLGFDSAVNCAVEEIDKIKQTMLSLNRIFICEVMGKRCADIAKHCAIATNASVLIAEEKDNNFEKIAAKIKSELRKGEESPLIVLRENILNAGDLGKKLQNKFDIETRSSVIGYVQRGTSPSIYDRIYAKQLASSALNLIKNEKFNLSLGIIDNKIISTTIEKSLIENKRDTSQDLTKFLN